MADALSDKSQKHDSEIKTDDAKKSDTQIYDELAKFLETKEQETVALKKLLETLKQR